MVALWLPVLHSQLKEPILAHQEVKEIKVRRDTRAPLHKLLFLQGMNTSTTQHLLQTSKQDHTTIISPERETPEWVLGLDPLLWKGQPEHRPCLKSICKGTLRFSAPEPWQMYLFQGSLLHKIHAGATSIGVQGEPFAISSVICMNWLIFLFEHSLVVILACWH